MVSYHLLNFIFPDSEWLPAVIYVALVSCLLVRVKQDCVILGESFGLHIFLVMMFPIITGYCWLIIWPGTLRLRFSGKTLEGTSQAVLLRRLQQSRRQSSQNNEQEAAGQSATAE